MSDEEPKFIAIDEETNDQIVHRRVVYLSAADNCLAPKTE